METLLWQRLDRLYRGNVITNFIRFKHAIYMPLFKNSRRISWEPKNTKVLLFRVHRRDTKMSQICNS